MRRTAFRLGMEKICSDFSRRNENIKVELHHRKPKNTLPFQKRNTTYILRLMKFSDIPNYIRDARFFNAEIPDCVREAQAREVREHDEDMDLNPAVVAEVVPAEIITEREFTREGRHVQFVEPENYSDAPLASEVALVDEDETPRQQRTVLERMQELETIRSYLSEGEYLSKRNEILESI